MKRGECLRVQRHSLIPPRVRRTLTATCHRSVDYDPRVEFEANFLGGTVDLFPPENHQNRREIDVDFTRI